METTKDILSERSPKFTFSHRNYKTLNNKRLDRFYTDQYLKAKQMELIETTQYSDHRAVTIEVYKEGETEIKRGPAYRKLNNTLLESRKFEKVIKVLLLATETGIHKCPDKAQFI